MVPVNVCPKEINLEAGTANELMNEIVRNEMLQSGRREGIARRRREMEERASVASDLRRAVSGVSSGQLSSSNRITSGYLASIEHYQLDATVHETIKERFDQAERDKARKAEKAKTKSAASTAKLAVVREKIRQKAVLDLKDLTTLVVAKKQPGDSAVKKGRDLVLRQAHNRVTRDESDPELIEFWQQLNLTIPEEEAAGGREQGEMAGLGTTMAVADDEDDEDQEPSPSMEV